MTNHLQNPLLTNEAAVPLMVVLSGPSGVGKDSVLAHMRTMGVPFHFVVTTNSRPRRPGERDGTDYHFVTNEQFEAMIANDELLEWAVVYGNYRGVPKVEVRHALASRRDVILRVNVDGAKTIKRIVPEAILIFIAPPSPDELRQRLYLRQTDSPDDIERRLTYFQEEMENVTWFDYVVINHAHRLDETVGHICAILTAERHRVFPQHIQW